MGLPLKKSLVSFIKKVLSIFRVNELIRDPTWLAPLLQSDAAIFERCVIGGRVEASIRSRITCDVLRRKIQNLSKLYFLFADSSHSARLWFVMSVTAPTNSEQRPSSVDG